jgi:GR25 family glycosyltransferase involved in LPS biosynthesis
VQLTDFDRIQCVCVDHRRNEWAAMEKQFKSRGAKIERFIVGKGKVLPASAYDQIDPPDLPPNHTWVGFTKNAYYCYMAHRAILERAKSDNLKNLLMVEDDCLFAEDFDQVLKRASQQLDHLGLKWDMFYFGSNHTWGKTQEVSPNILRLLGGSYCWHCVAINQAHNDMFSHLLSLPGQGAFDWLTSRYTQPNFQCYAIWPNIALQKPGMSYVLGSMQDYRTWLTNKDGKGAVGA